MLSIKFNEIVPMEEDNFQNTQIRCKLFDKIKLETKFTSLEIDCLRDGQIKCSEDFIEDIQKSLEFYEKQQNFHFKLNVPDKELQIFVYSLLDEAEKVLEKMKDFIKKNITNNFDPQKLQCTLFKLQRHSGNLRVTNNQDLLKSLLSSQKIEQLNPFLQTKKEQVEIMLMKYVKQEVIVETLKRNLNLILSLPSQKENARNYLLQQIANNLHSQRLQLDHKERRDWLLFELENKIILRHSQVEVLKEMTGKEDKRVMFQLNMGEGKSSVLLFLLANYFADGEKVLRLNVLESLYPWMKSVLMQKFSGLLSKKVFVLPFERAVEISLENLQLLRSQLSECKENRHIVVITPSSRLCLQLKLREMHLQLLECFEPKEKFEWQEIETKMRENCAEVAESEKQALRELLVKRGVIDKEHRILNAPVENQEKQKLIDYLQKQMRGSKTLTKSVIKLVLRQFFINSSTARRNLQEKFQEMKKISEDFRFFDILDESDVILRHGTELNYSIGDKKLTDGGENRWVGPQKLLSVLFENKDVRSILEEGRENGMLSMDVEWKGGNGIPKIQLIDEEFFSENIKPKLAELLVKIDIFLILFMKVSVTPSQVENYLMGKERNEKDFLKKLEKDENLLSMILAIKGWLNEGIMFHVFSSPYRVRYGLTSPLEEEPTKLIAVPFQGKDNPSLRSDFSHMDVMIGFTILSHLYRGLHQNTFKQTIERVKKVYPKERAEELFSNWLNETAGIKNQEIPPFLSSLEHLDLNNEKVLRKAAEFLGRNMNLVFFYLNQFVFPENCFEFHTKISANGHNLADEKTGSRVTGFSGTDEKKLTMPYFVECKRSPSQETTNAKMLQLMLKKENTEMHFLDFNSTSQFLKEVISFLFERKLQCSH